MRIHVACALSSKAPGLWSLGCLAQSHCAKSADGRGGQEYGPQVAVWLDVDWDNPAPNGAYIQAYEIGYREKGTGAWTSKGKDGTDYSDTAILGGTFEKTCEVQVRARSAAGWSAWSAAGEANTPDASMAKPPNPAHPDFNYHTHKADGLGETGIGECRTGGRVFHDYTGTDGGSRSHWHCPG